MGGVKYQRLDDEAKKVGNTAYKPLQEWSDEEKTLLNSLQVGDEFVVNKKEVEYTTADGITNTTWRLWSITDKSLYKPKEPKNNFKKSSWNGGGFQDNISAKIGGLAHDAVAMLGVGATVKDVGRTIRELLKEVMVIEEEVKAGAYKSTLKGKADDIRILGGTPNTEVGTSDNVMFDTLENIDW